MPATRAELKRRMLKLLKEDEEFRHTVIGFLGIEDIKSGQARLESAIARLVDSQARLEEAHTKLEEAVTKLVERQDRLEQRVIGLDGTVTRLEGAVAKLAEAQARTELTLQELSKHIDTLSVRVDELSKHVSRLSETIGFGLEDIARVVVPGWLYRHEMITVDELIRKLFTVDEEEIEINLYGEGSKDGMKVIILGEVKSRIYASDVEDFDRLAEKLRMTFVDNVYKLMFGYYIHPSAEDEAKKRGITLIASYMR